MGTSQVSCSPYDAVLYPEYQDGTQHVRSESRLRRVVSGDSWITRGSVICTAHKITLGWSNAVGWGAGDVRIVQEGLEMRVESEVQTWGTAVVERNGHRWEVPLGKWPSWCKITLYKTFIVGSSGRSVYGRSPAEIVGSKSTGAWMFVCCECCVLSGRGLRDEPITRPGESYRLWCVVVCDLETSWMRRPWSALGRSATRKKYITSKYLPRHGNCALVRTLATCPFPTDCWCMWLIKVNKTCLKVWSFCSVSHMVSSIFCAC